MQHQVDGVLRKGDRNKEPTAERGEEHLIGDGGVREMGEKHVGSESGQPYICDVGELEHKVRVIEGNPSEEAKSAVICA